MPWRLLLMPVLNFAEGVYDACRDTVEPELGSIVYCDLLFGYMEHSGVYVGNNRIVHLDGSGEIEMVTPKQFINGSTACSIYVSCSDETAVGCTLTAHRALTMVGQSRSYNFLMDNCHQFSAGCMTGDFENSCNFLWMLKDESKKYLYSNDWRVWDIDLFA